VARRELGRAHRIAMPVEPLFGAFVFTIVFQILCVSVSLWLVSP
jgi:hypothetical protein